MNNKLYNLLVILEDKLSADCQVKFLKLTAKA